MKTNLIKIIVAVVIAGFMTSASTAVNAQEKKEKPAATASASKDRKMPFNGKIAEINKDAKTLKIGTRTFHVTAETAITKDGDKPATLDDAKIGEIAGGSYKDNAGKLELVKIRIGPKPAAGGKEVAAKKKKKSE